MDPTGFGPHPTNIPPGVIVPKCPEFGWRGPAAKNVWSFDFVPQAQGTTGLDPMGHVSRELKLLVMR